MGEYVKISGKGPYDACTELQVVDVKFTPRFHYMVEVKSACGPRQFVRDPKTGHGNYQQVFQPGVKFSVVSDEPGAIERRVRVELKKCRVGMVEQEFQFVSMGSDISDNNNNKKGGGEEATIAVIQHTLTNTGLATVLGANSPFFNISQVWNEDSLFEGSGDYFYVKAIIKANDGRVNADGSPYVPPLSYLASGSFGVKEYSEAQMHSLAQKPGFTEQEFAMWEFKPFLKGDSDNESSAIDEHSEWLVRMTQMIGIDYLEQLPPWHLLDVERTASKSDVKARFRELSRSFHPDKLVTQNQSKKELYERIFVLLQNAYQGLKSANEKEKEEFRVQAETSSQLFAHSQYVVELLPFHWTRLDNREEDDEEEGSGRYILNTASHLNSTLMNVTVSEEESGPSVQIWVTFMYSARCGMSKTVVGFIDLAARHLEQHENIKVGAYGCGLYKDHPPKKSDPTGVLSDPICAQFARKETPNVHVIVETLPGRMRDENGMFVEVPPDAELVKENAIFKYFYSAVPTGNTTQFYPHNFINFAQAGKRVWQNNHLVRRMTSVDFADPKFIGNASIVAYVDGTGKGDTDAVIVEAVTNSLPGVAHRFLDDDVYVGIASCGYGDEYDLDEDDAESQKYVDCSKLGVSWLPDVKIYGVNDTEGVSLLRGQFGDIRDVQIALESMGNVLRMMIGGTDNDLEDDFEELPDEDNADEGGGSCGSDQPPPPPPDYDLDLDEIDGRMEDTPLLEMDAEEDGEATKPPLEVPKKPKLASGGEEPQLSGGREHAGRDRISGFHQRETRKAGGGQLLGGGGGGSAGFIA